MSYKDTMIGYNRRADFYELEYDTVEDQRFLNSFINSNVHNILEIPCGCGRNVHWLGKTGRKTTLVDLEQNMLEQVKKRASKYKNIVCDIGDMRYYSKGKKFDLIIVPRESFQLLINKSDCISALKNFKRNLTVNGKLVIDLFKFSRNKDETSPVYFNAKLRDGKIVSDWSKTNISGTKVIRCHSQETFKNHINITFYYREGENKFVHKMSLRKHSFIEFKKMAQIAKLRIVTAFGDYKKHPYANNNRLLLVLAHD